MSDFKEFDLVALLQDWPEHGLRRGQMGTIVMVLSPEDFEVEFIGNDGYTYAVLALSSDKLMRIHRDPPQQS